MAEFIIISIFGFMVFIFVVAVLRFWLLNRKINDKPIPHLKCKFCGKPQILEHRLDACQHQWIEE